MLTDARREAEIVLQALPEGVSNRLLATALQLSSDTLASAMPVWEETDSEGTAAMAFAYMLKVYCKQELYRSVQDELTRRRRVGEADTPACVVVSRELIDYA